MQAVGIMQQRKNTNHTIMWLMQCVSWEVPFRVHTKYPEGNFQVTRRMENENGLKIHHQLPNFVFLCSPSLRFLYQKSLWSRGEGSSIVFHLSFLTHSACQYDVT